MVPSKDVLREGSKLTNWLYQQGVSTVLLFMILIFMGCAMIWIVPDHITALNKGRSEDIDRQMKTIEKISADNQKNLELIIKTFDSDQTRDENRYKDLLTRKLGSVGNAGSNNEN